MQKLSLRAYAKINLALAIQNKRSDGYHNLSTIMQTVSIYDRVCLQKSDKITCNTNERYVPNGGENIAFKAAEMFFNFTKIDAGVDIFIDKNIPFGAGMGGGSSDAAAVFVGLNKLYCANIDDIAMIKLASKVGADVPFLIKGGTALVEGVGDIITNIKPVPKCNILIVKPNVSVSTADAYGKYDNLFGESEASANFLIHYIEKDDLDGLCFGLFNDFEKVIEISTIKEIKEQIMNRGALTSCMTGSGSAVFGIYKNFEEADRARIEFEKEGFLSFVCEPTEKNNLIIE